CMLCHRTEADPVLCGNILERLGVCAHVFCLHFASLLFQQGGQQVGLMGYLLKDIRCAVNRAAQKADLLAVSSSHILRVCGGRGATIICYIESCYLSFHLPCASLGCCVTQYMAPYRSLCIWHRPQQAMQATPKPSTKCCICMESVGEKTSIATMVCPACKTTWFHRDCIQQQAVHTGLLVFRCPLCKNDEEFVEEMLMMGIRVPFRKTTWEDNNASAQQKQRHSLCNASECLCPGGREEAEEEGAWEMFLCCSCAAQGTHRRCSGLEDSTTSWECNSC
ncbi:PHD finger protein 7, partial [Acanthisitta chloris]